MADNKENTPVKVMGVRAKQRRFRFCIICARDLHLFRKYCTIMKDGVGEKLACILQRNLKDISKVSNSICYNCKQKVEQISNLTELETSVKQSFAAAETLVESPVAGRVKRMSHSPGKPRKKPTVRELIESQTSSGEYPCTQVKLLITRRHGTEEINVPGNMAKFVILACKEENEEMAAVIWEDSSFRTYLQSYFLKEISTQCSSIRSDTSTFGYSQRAIEEWSYIEQENELQTMAPTFHSVLKAAAHEQGSKPYENILPGVMTAAGVLLCCRNQRLNAVQLMSAVQMKRSGAASKVFDRLSHRFLSVSYKTCLRFQKRLGANFDKKVLQWKSDMEHALRQENIPSSGPSIAHPGYRLVGDNVDIMVSPRQTSISHASSDLHYFNVMAVKNRIYGEHLSSKRKKDPADQSAWLELLPSIDDHQSLVSEWTILIGRVICKYLPKLAWMRHYLPEHIPDEYSPITKKKSEVVNLGVITENENTHEGIAAIMEKLQTYVPVVDGQPIPVISGGDLLTCEREMNCKEDRQDSSDPVCSWKGLVPVIEDFHTTANFYEVIWHFLYSTSSARDHGTLFAARNFLNARGVSNQPMKDVNASSELLDNYTDAMIVASSMEFFGMNSASEEPTRHMFDMMAMDPNVYVKDTLQTIVKKFAVHDGPELGSPVEIKCPTCGKVYRKVATLRKHMKQKHSDLPTVSTTSPPQKRSQPKIASLITVVQP